ncbi:MULTISPECIES: hypothetical protein [unclassified Crossiella]|uniref:hypothetical protein n=1 Tax=unclassified Crossiella TaxID=2620835 RepID=UPI001FFFBEAC|nr:MULTISPECIES: hypothetical protein [unclassified Crossiella]MCK2241236.1 hypothetical protein [Crossiella sp. S99.2]MCK2253620.1 hypothetical protein [Crossiella sp. S99.1]
MDDSGPLQQLHRTKLALIAILLTVTGMGLLFLSKLEPIKQLYWFPVEEFGQTLMGTGLVSTLLIYFDYRDYIERLIQLLEALLAQQVPAIKQSVIDGFAAAPREFSRTATPDALDEMIESSLAVRLKNPPLAADLTQKFRRQVEHSTVTSSDTRVSIVLTPWTEGPAHGLGAMFVAEFTWEHYISALPTEENFWCVSDRTTRQQATRDPANAGVWLLDPTSGISAASPEAFELVRYAVNGTAQKIVVVRGDSQQFHSVTLDHNHTRGERGFHLSYKYRALLQQHGHLYLALTKTSDGLQVNLTHQDCDIAHIRVADYVSSLNPARVYTSPAGARIPEVSVGCDGWVYPGSGVTFTWALKRELQQ